MTTDDEATTTTDETTDTEERKDRSIQELLRLDTYQGMTDTEITSIVDYAVRQAATQAAQNVNVKVMQAGYDALVQQAQAASDALRASVDAANATASEFKAVSYE